MCNLKNKNILVTGGTLGLGFQLASHFIQNGANVIICSRKTKNINSAYNKLKTKLKNKQILFAFKADLSKEIDVKNLYKKISKKFNHIDILVSNAGVYGPKGPLIDINWNDWKKSFNINFFGSVFLIKVFTRLIKKSTRGKIIQLSGGGATSPLPNLSCYAGSKAAIVRFVETISIELLKFDIDVNCIAPGALNTRLLDEVIKAGPKKVGNSFYQKSLEQKRTGGAGYSNVIALCEFLCSAKSNGITGKLISAQWDNYHKLAKKNLLNYKSDVFTLRRIVGKDRKLNFLDK
jgi:NAD(P)-dependent dehydrogenase (short-subunit alcohol dehydrogenase family)